MARRDAWRHRGRSLLALLMIAVPTSLLCFALTANATANISGAELIAPKMGDGVAYLETPRPSPIEPNPWSDFANGTGGATTAIPGYVAAEGDQPATSTTARRILSDANTRAIAALVGGRATPLTKATALATTTDGGRVEVDLALTTAPQELTGMFGLQEGRWPGTAREIVVTSAGLRAGLPRSGDVQTRLTGFCPTCSEADRSRTVTVVGVAETQSSAVGAIGSLSGWPLTWEDQAGGWVIHRATPMTWGEVKSLATYGILALSADVLRHPPALSEVAPSVVENHLADAQRMRLLVGAGGAILLIASTLLVGPAFAVGAGRQRRTLAVAASNGAETAQLRRTVLGQAVVIGVVAAVVGGLLGVGSVGALLALFRDRSRDLATSGPWDVPWAQVGVIVAMAAVSALIAALLPARRLGRLDIVGAMRGQVGAGRPSRLLFVCGLVLAALGGAVTMDIVANRRTGIPLLPFLQSIFSSEVLVVLSTVVLVVGALCLVPTVLHLLAGAARVLPLPMRLALRDLDRHRSRSAPAVAAVVGVVAAFTVLGIGLTSDTSQQARDYTPTAALGEGYLSTIAQGPASGTGALTAMRGATPNLQFTPLHAVGMSVVESVPEGGMPWAVVVPAGCTTAQAAGPAPENGAMVASSTGLPIERGLPTNENTVQMMEGVCQRLGTYGGGNAYAIITLPADRIVSRFDLTGADADRVRSGGAVVWEPKMTAAQGGSMTLAWGTSTPDPTSGMTTAFRETGRLTIPVVAAPATRANLGLFPQEAGMIVAAEALAGAKGLPQTQVGYLVGDPSGAVSKADEAKLKAALPESGFRVERGYERQDRFLMAIIVGVMILLLLVVTLTTTALSVAEQQQDQATYAALGATRGTRRAMAAAAAYVTTLVGVVVGMAVGWVPGVAISYPLTAQSYDPISGGAVGGHVTEIPWAWFAIVLVAAPVVAAALAWIGIRRAPSVVRRAT